MTLILHPSQKGWFCSSRESVNVSAQFWLLLWRMWEDVAIGMWCIEAKDAAKYPTVHSTTSYQKELSDPKCSWGWKPYCRIIGNKSFKFTRFSFLCFFSQNLFKDSPPSCHWGRCSLGNWMERPIMALREPQFLATGLLINGPGLALLNHSSNTLILNKWLNELTCLSAVGLDL